MNIYRNQFKNQVFVFLAESSERLVVLIIGWLWSRLGSVPMHVIVICIYINYKRYYRVVWNIETL